MNLVDLIRKEHDLLCRMGKMLEKENTALVNDDIASLAEIVRGKEKLNDSIRELERKRTGICGSLSLREIARHLKRVGKDEEADEVDALRADMKGRISDIKRLNDTNSLLLRLSLSYVKSVLNILSPGKNMMYNHSGEISGDVRKNNALDISI